MAVTKYIDVKLTELKDKNVTGIMAQVVNPRFLKTGQEPMFRVLKGIRTYTQSGKEWIEVSWKGEPTDSCNFTGCTIESDVVVLQFTKIALDAIERQSRAPKVKVKREPAKVEQAPGESSIERCTYCDNEASGRENGQPVCFACNAFHPSPFDN